MAEANSETIIDAIDTLTWVTHKLDVLKFSVKDQRDYSEGFYAGMYCLLREVQSDIRGAIEAIEGSIKETKGLEAFVKEEV